MFKHFILCSKAIFITVILLMVTGCSDNNETETKVENALRGPVVLADSPQAMNLEQRMQRYKVPNVSIAVVSGSAIDFAKAYGANVDQNTLFQAGSISKTLNAFGILTLVSQGKVNLDKDVNQYLKRWKIKHNKYYKETDKITLRQILSHSAGFNAPELRVYEVGKKLPSTPEILNGEPGVANAKPVEVICNPGEKFQYSNYGIVVSQLVLEDVTGEDYADWMQKNVLEPLGMNNSTFKQPLPLVLQSKAIAGHDADGKVIAGKYSAFPSATGGLWSTPTDLAKFVLAMFKISDGSQDYSISKKLQDEMFAKQINDEEFSSNYYGLGVSLAGDNNNFYFSHNGRTEGFISGMVAYPKLKKAFIIMINHDTACYFLEEITNGIADTYNLPGFDKVAKESIEYSLSDYPNILGNYKTSDEYSIKIISKGNSLYLYRDNLKVEEKLYLGTNGRFFILEQPFEGEYLPQNNEVKIYFPGVLDEVDTLTKTDKLDRDDSE